MGKIISVNLRSGSIKDKPASKKTQESYLGGRGLGAYLYSKNPLKADDPNNSVFLVPGILTGSLFPSSSRLEVVTSSPLTNCYTASSTGGHFGAYLKHNGIDALEITGRSEKWVYLVIENGKVETRNADKLIGKTTYETRKILSKDFEGKKVSISVIGPAGENLVKFATLIFDERAAGRTGTGWHFGYKKLKAVVVVDKKTDDAAHDPKKVKELMKRLMKLKIESDKQNETYATSTYTEYSNDMQTYPASNYRRNFVSEEEISGLSYEEYEKRSPKKSACWSCPLACTLDVKSKNRGMIRGPEYETIWSLGANCDNFDLDVVIECNYLCNSYGLDTISTGSVLAWYKECIDEGLVKDKWTGKRMVESINDIANRKDLGNALAEGTVAAAKKLGYGESLIAHSKGLELPAWDPRTAIGMAVAYATAPTGGDHCKAWTVSSDTSDPEKQFQTKGKAEEVIKQQNMSALLDSTGTCMFADFMYGSEIWSEVLDAYLGISITPKNLEKIGETIFQLEHQINENLRHDTSENILPERIIGYEIEVRGKKVKLTQEMFDEMMKEYYKLRKWKNTNQ